MNGIKDSKNGYFGTSQFSDGKRAALQTAPARWSRPLMQALMMACFLAFSLGSSAGVVEDETTLRQDLVPSKHIAWCRPAAKGPVSVLFIGASSGTFAREAVELAQRFDLRYEFIPVDLAFTPSPEFGASPEFAAHQERARRLLEQKWDCYAIGWWGITKAPPEFQYMVLKAVGDGAGLVCFGGNSIPQGVVKKERYVQEGLAEILAHTAFAPGKIPFAGDVAAFRFGNGRCVWIPGSGWNNFIVGGLPDNPDSAAPFENLAALSGASILYASGKLPAVRVLGTEPALAEIGLSDLPKKGIAINFLAAAQPDENLEARLSVRDMRGNSMEMPKGRLSFADCKASLPIEIPQLSAGQHFLDVIVSGSKGVQGFSSIPFKVVADAGIASVTVKENFVERGGKIEGELKLSGAVRPGSDKVLMSFRDRHGRALDRKEFPAPAADQPLAFSFTTEWDATQAMFAEASLVRDGRTVESKQAVCYVPDRRQGGFVNVVWDCPNGWLGRIALDQLRHLGYSCILRGTSDETSDIAARNGFSLVPYATRITFTVKDGKMVIKPASGKDPEVLGCWNDPATGGAAVKEIVARQMPARKAGTYVYSLGDETTTTGCCLHPECLKAYRAYLKEQYGTIEKLNESWGSDYDDFAEVNVLKEGDNLEADARERKMNSRWFDRQAYARRNFVNYCVQFVEEFKKLDPKALVGFEGAGGFGDDVDDLISRLGFWSPYADISNDIVRSMAPRGGAFPRSNWTGYTRGADTLIATYWQMMMHGMHGIWWWRWDGTGVFHGLLAPDLGPYPAIQELASDTAVLHQGLGELVVRAEMPDDGVGILYSFPSALGGALDPGPQFGDCAASHLMFQTIVHELGLQFRYISSRQVAAGGLAKAGYKVLILPYSQALDTAECAAIRKFVEDGGTVIADLRPGVWDEHCKPLEKGRLDDVFGIVRTGPGDPKIGPVKFEASLDGVPLSLELDASRMDGNVKPASAKAMSEVQGAPVMLVNQFGKGRAILLNFHLASYLTRREVGQERAIGDFFAALMKSAGVKPRYALANSAGSRPQSVNPAWFKLGDLELAGLLRTMPGEEPVSISLDKPAYAYDLRARKALGKVEKAASTLRMGKGQFYAFLPYEVEGVEVESPDDDPERGKTSEFSLEIEGAPENAKGPFPVKVEMIGPDGKNLPWLEKVVLLDSPKGKVPVRFAHDDPPGKYKLRATELFTGKTGEDSISLGK